MSKSYEAAVSPSRLFVEALFGIKGRRESVDALKPLDLDIHRGTSVGILGRNGAGKSTLLSLLAGHISPTTGTVTKYGRVAALIGIGQQFNIKESGRYNAAQFCRVQGIRGEKAKRAIAEIEQFSELGAFFDRPVKTYSSGMRARLSFSCATFVEADLIIVDEVLAVGDAEFRSKCYGHIESSIDAGQTYILVSHSPAIVGNYCSRSIVLNKGELVFDGDPLGGMQAYEESVSIVARRKRSAAELMKLRIENSEEVNKPDDLAINSIRIECDTVLQDDEASDKRIRVVSPGEKVLISATEEPARVTVQVQSNIEIARPRVAAAWRNSKGIVTAAHAKVLSDQSWEAGKTYDVEFTFVPRLVVGGYLLRFSVADYSDGSKDLKLEKEGLLELNVVEGYRAGLVDLQFEAKCIEVNEGCTEP